VKSVMKTRKKSNVISMLSGFTGEKSTTRRVIDLGFLIALSL
jgi:hypothetical protein